MFLDILEYIGGVLLGAISKQANEAIATCLTSAAPSGNLIKVMQKKVGGLKSPSEQFHGMVLRFYVIHSKEMAKPLKKINFFRVLDAIHCDP